MNTPKISFGSDNQAPIHPLILEKIIEINNNYAIGYGNDPYTEQARSLLKNEFNADQVFFTYNGTAANVLALSSCLKPYEAVITAQTAHINTDECGALENYSGSKIISLPTNNGKITAEQLYKTIKNHKSVHQVKPKIVSITQSTEYGTVYSLKELTELTQTAHELGLLIHMDGNRLYNAAAFLNISLKAMTHSIGIDILSLGGTKNGGLSAESILFFNSVQQNNFGYIHKQGMQLASKMRYLSAQYIALFSNNLWHSNALHANHMAKKLATNLSKINGITITQPVEANAIFAIVPPHILDILKTNFYCYPWNSDNNEVRLMTSWYTQETDITALLETITKHSNF